MFKCEYAVMIYGVTVPVYRLQNGSVVVAASDFLRRIGLMARDIRELVDFAKANPFFRKRMFCIDDVSYLDVNFISAWLSHANLDKYADEYRGKIELFQAQAQCIICDTIYGKNSARSDFDASVLEEIKQQNFEILCLLKSMTHSDDHAVSFKPVVQINDSGELNFSENPEKKGKAPRSVSPETAWMKSVTERIENRIAETGVDLTTKKALFELYRYMNTSYGFVADQIRKDMRDDADSKKITTLETIAHSPEWKDIFESVLHDYLANMSTTKNTMAKNYETRIEELVTKVAEKIGDKTPSKSKTYVKIYDEMYSPLSWRMRVGRFCHGSIPRNFSKKAMILSSQQYADRFIEVANDILNRESV